MHRTRKHLKNPIGRIRIMNDTSSYGDTPISQIWLANVNPKEKLWAGHENMSKTL